MSGTTQLGGVDDTDGLNDDQEMEEWKLRELRRIERDKKEAEQYFLEKDEHNMEIAPVEKESRHKKYGRGESEDESHHNRPKLQFLQRYYHKGAFYQASKYLSLGFLSPLCR